MLDSQKSIFENDVSCNVEGIDLEKYKRKIEQQKTDFMHQPLDSFVSKIKNFDLLSKTYNDIKEDVENKKQFEDTIKYLAYDLIPNSLKMSVEADLKCAYELDENFLNVIGLSLQNEKTIEYPLQINNNESFSILITTDDQSRNKAEQFVQYIIYKIALLSKKGDALFRCIDAKKNGISFGKVISLINKNQLFGKKIYSTENDIIEVIEELNSSAEQNILNLKGRYKSVFEYNQVEQYKIPITLSVFCDVSNLGYSKNENMLQNLMDNSEYSGMSFLFLCDEGSALSSCKNQKQIHMVFKNNCVYLDREGFQIPVNIDNACFSDKDYLSLESKLNKVEKVNTSFDAHFDIDSMPLFTKDATMGLSVPFAFDEHNNFVNLEIGDETPHALLSGSTGSGKSVTLHSIINQIMINYHPADVEIWAIDYKAVEFGCYVNKRTPHITVIGQDNSDDFTFGLLDLIKEEYDRRKAIFVKENVKNFKEYRQKCGRLSISRILIIIDEFHNMTQAIQNYGTDKDYKTILENLLSEMRAMGMSFLFCSQTIVAGLSGLTDKGRSQIGCRLSMKHEDIAEIKETLSLSASSEVDFESIKYLRQGELVYKRITNDVGETPYTLEKVNVLYTEPLRDKIIDKVNSNIESDYIPRKEIICKNSSRYCVLEKEEHPISKFMLNGESIETEGVQFLPGAPTSLKDYFSFILDDEAGNNVLLVGEEDSKRESIIISVILGLLLDSSNEIIVSILDDSDDSKRIYFYLNKIKSCKLKINYGYDAVTRCIQELKVLKPTTNGKKIYVWYGLNKLKNIIFLHSQSSELKEENNKLEFEYDFEGTEEISPLEFLNSALSSIEGANITEKAHSDDEKLSYASCQNIFSTLEEYGPENNIYNFVIFNTFRSLKKSKLINLENYEYRIGLKMSTDDSYDLFGSTAFISKANENTAVFYDGSKNCKTIRPYLIPNDDFFGTFNSRIKENMG